MSDDTEITYDAINFDGLERRANYRIIAYREDMLHIFERRDAASILYHIIYRWQTEYRRGEILKEIERRKKANLTALTAEEVESMAWVYMSYNDFVRESGHALGYNTVIRTLDYLINDVKVFEQRPNHDPHYPDYEYRINKEVVKSLLKKLPAEPVFSPKIPKRKSKSTQTGTDTNDSTQTGTPDNSSTQMGTQSTQKGIATTHLGTGVYPNGGTSQITHRNTQVSSQEEGSATSLQEDRNAHPLINLEMKRVEKRETNPRVAAISVSSHSQGLSEEGDITDAPTEKMPITKPQQTISAEGLPAPAALTDTPLPPVRSVQQGAMAMTPRQIKAQAERREKELWAIIEDERGTTYTTRQRALHKEGIALLIADDISDEVMIKGLRSLSGFERQTFTVLKFYGWLPNLSAKAPTSTSNGKAPTFVIDEERNKRNIEAMKARNAQRRLEAHG